MAVKLSVPYFSVLCHSNHSSFIFRLGLIIYKSHFKAEAKILLPLNQYQVIQYQEKKYWFQVSVIDTVVTIIFTVHHTRYLSL